MRAQPDRVRPILDQNACRFTATGDVGLDSLVQNRLATLGPTSMLFYERPLEIVRGEGVWLYDADGRVYLDAYNNVPVLGHCHPKVVEAVSSQLGQLNIHTRYLDRALHRYAEQLLDTLPVADGRLVLTCTGSEANDLALRLAGHWTGRQGVIVTEAAYHGNTDLVSAVSPSGLKQGTVPDWVITLSVDPLRSDPASAAAAFDAQVAQALELLQHRGYGCAALLVDSILSSDGVFADPVGFFGPAVARVRAAGGVLIADEVQPGFGRCGETFWGFQRHALVPEIVTLGKPMGNGYPIAGVVAGRKLLARFSEQQGYFNTFGGSTAAIAAAQAVLDTLQQEGIAQQAQQTGVYLKRLLNQLAQRWPVISSVRGVGLYLGVDICDPHSGEPDALLTTALINGMREQQVLIGAAGKHGNTLKIRPPLCFSTAHADRLVVALDRVLTQCFVAGRY